MKCFIHEPGENGLTHGNRDPLPEGGGADNRDPETWNRVESHETSLDQLW